ncbi:MAG: putative sulfate exporter family transporter [Firmicutes bacterium]|nr:putative sulfate exporter family transporter [Bacillota bacterium]
MRSWALGIGVCCLIATISHGLGDRIPVIGASILALAIGMLANLVFTSPGSMEKGLEFVSKTVLRISIILLGTGLSITQVLAVGKYSLVVMVFTLTAAFGSGCIFGRLLGVNWKLSNLIAAGTGICGGSAIATLSPIIGADDTEVAYAMSATFIFDVLMILLFPLMGHWLGLSDLAYGLWTGTAVNDTSSVVAAGYAYSEAAGDFATIVKLTRTTSIVPIALIFSIVVPYKTVETQEVKKHHSGGMSIKELFPWFILLFALGAMANTLGFIPMQVQYPLKQISKFLMAMALAAIGLRTNFKQMLDSGIYPMTLGFIVSLIVVVVSILVQFLLGQV